MNVASLFNLAGPDLVFIFLIVVLLFGAKKAHTTFEAFRRWNRERGEPAGDPPSPMELVNRAILALAITLLILACGLGFLDLDN